MFAIAYTVGNVRIHRPPNYYSPETFTVAAQSRSHKTFSVAKKRNVKSVKSAKTGAPERYQVKHPVRFVTATSLFDGHDASINIMRRMLQAGGAEVVHLGHNRSVEEIVVAAIEEDAHGIAVSSYQGGHVEFFKYMVDLLKERKAGHIKVFGGGGGVIIPEEIAELHKYGVTRIYSPGDGQFMGLEGMIDDMLKQSDHDLTRKQPKTLAKLKKGDSGTLAQIGRAHV